MIIFDLQKVWLEHFHHFHHFHQPLLQSVFEHLGPCPICPFSAMVQEVPGIEIQGGSLQGVLLRGSKTNWYSHSSQEKQFVLPEIQNLIV